MSSDPRSSELVVRALLDGGRQSANPVVAFVEVLLSGFGYDFHDPANVARSNDQRVRARSSELLGEAAQLLGSVEAEFKATYVPPSTREQPFPPDRIMKALRKVHALRTHIADVASLVLTLEAPGTDRIWARLRNERALLEKLISADIAVAAGAEDVLTATRELNAAAVDQDRTGSVETLVVSLEKTIRARRSLLS